MKNIWFILAVWGCCQFVSAAVTFYTYQQTDLEIGSSAPPAIVYVSDSQGRRTGADPSLPVNNDGTQGRLLNNGLMEIPSSLVMQMPIENSSSTGWDISIADGGAQTYTINVLGVVTGDEEFGVGAVLVKNGKHSYTQHQLMDVLVASGQLRQVTLSFDPAKETISLNRVVGSSDLLSDVKIACQLNLITSQRTCIRLEEKAEAIQDASEKNQKDKLDELVKNFLFSLGENMGKDDDEKIDLDSIKKQALTVLKEDAKALLSQIETQGRIDHYDKIDSH